MRFFTAIPAVICFVCCWSLLEARVAYINSTMNGSEIATTIRTETGCSGASVEVVLNATESPMSTYSASQVKAVLDACLAAAPPSTRMNVSGNDAETQAPVRVGCDDCSEQNITISNSLLSLKGLAFKNCQVQLSGLVSADLSIESCRFASVDCSRRRSAPAIGNSAQGVAASLAVSNASRVTLTNCNFSENVITPAILSSIKDVTVDGCHFENNNLSDAHTLLGKTNSTAVDNVYISSGLILVADWSALETYTWTIRRSTFAYNNLTVNGQTAMDSMTSLHGSGALLVVFKSNLSANLGQLDVTDCTFESNRVALPESITPHYYSGARYLRGGGMHLMFTGTAMGNRVNIVDSNFQSNAAPNGGGLALYFDDQSSRNNVSISDKSPDRMHSFWNNKALTPCYEGNVKVPGTGGAVNVEFFGHSKQNSVELDGLDLTGNVANKGGALYVGFHDSEQKNSILVEGSVFKLNNAMMGAAAVFWGGGPATSPTQMACQDRDITVHNCSFEANTAQLRWSVPPHVC